MVRPRSSEKLGPQNQWVVAREPLVAGGCSKPVRRECLRINFIAVVDVGLYPRIGLEAGTEMVFERFSAYSARNNPAIDFQSEFDSFIAGSRIVEMGWAHERLLLKRCPSMSQSASQPRGRAA